MPGLEPETDGYKSSAPPQHPAGTLRCLSLSLYPRCAVQISDAAYGACASATPSRVLSPCYRAMHSRRHNLPMHPVHHTRWFYAARPVFPYLESPSHSYDAPAPMSGADTADAAPRLRQLGQRTTQYSESTPLQAVYSTPLTRDSNPPNLARPNVGTLFLHGAWSPVLMQTTVLPGTASVNNRIQRLAEELGIALSPCPTHTLSTQCRLLTFASC